MVSKKGLIWAKERNTDKILLLISMNNIQHDPINDMIDFVVDFKATILFCPNMGNANHG
jgi:hypothetical protein